MHLEIKYINQLSPQLSRFKKKKSTLWNFRCPFCGDSRKDAKKARAYFFENEPGKIRFKCHNCNRGPWKIGYVLKQLDEDLYKEYLMESLGPTKRNKDTTPDLTFNDHSELQERAQNRLNNETLLSALQPVKELGEGHIAFQYLQSRMIPDEYWERFYYISEFKKWINTILPGKFEEPIKFDEDRLIMPFWDENKEIHAFQGRHFKQNESFKYITIKVDDEKPKIYGLDRVDKSEFVYIVEGGIDSLFLDNAVAASGSDLNGSMFDDYVLVYDNQPRNKELINKIQQSINHGDKVCFFGHENVAFKEDINDLAKKGYSKEDLHSLIDKNTVQGLEAQLLFNQWKKV